MTQTPARPAGAPAWIDLGTPDLEGSLAFYGDLFGWTFTDQGDDFGHYHLIHAGDALVGGLMSTVGMTCPEGGEVPTEWGVYLSAPDAAATIARVPGAGGHVLLEPMPVGEHGLMALLKDPAGAAVGLWQPGTLDGIDVPGQPGTPVWFEAMTTDFDAALPFYRDVLGWDVHWSAGDPSGEGEQGWRYATHGPEAQALAGLCDANGVVAAGTPSYWRIYFSITDLDREMARVAELGGETLDGPADSPYGRVATIRDPQGATFQFVEDSAS